jgi:hypothetical protein
MAAAFANIRGAGIAPVVASGNNGSDAGVAQPACLSTAIAVGNTTKADADRQHEHIANGSNHHDLVELLAPGTRILAAVPPGATCSGSSNGYCRKTGTSMAAPHVAGAFAALRQVQPDASVDRILEALECSGKTVERPEGAGLDKPRIDLIGAYQWVVKPPNARRSWSFEEAEQALEWTPFLGDWLAQDGRYAPKPISDGAVLSSTASCNRSLEVLARIRRVYPVGGEDDPSIAPNAGIILKSKLNYRTRRISGYFFGYLYLPRVEEADRRGWGFIQRIDQNSSTVLCLEDTDVPVDFRNWNTIRAVSDGARHRLYINGKLICQANDATYRRGPVSVITGYSSSYPTTGGTFSVESVSIRSRDDAGSDGGGAGAALSASAARWARASGAGEMGTLFGGTPRPAVASAAGSR